MRYKHNTSLSDAQKLTKEEQKIAIRKKMDCEYEKGEMFVTIDEVRKAKTPELLWGNWLVKNTITLQSAIGGISKTTFNFSLITNLQDEGEFLGVKGKKIKILYFDYESEPSLIKSRMNLIGKLMIDHPYFKYCNKQYTLDEIEPYVNKFISDYWKPDIIFIDPLSIALKMENENDNVEATNKMKYLRECMNAWDTTLVLVTHSGKSDSWGVGSARGAGSQGNLADIVWNFHDIGKEFGDDKFAFEIPKNRFINDKFLICMQKIEGSFIPVEFPEGYNKNLLESTGIKTFKIGEEIELIMQDKQEHDVPDIMRILKVDEKDQSKRAAVYRAITPLLQKDIIKRIRYGIYIWNDERT